MIEVRRFGGRRPTIIVVDGEPMPVSAAAERFGVSMKTMQKRIQRGGDLTMPVKRKNAGSWALQGL